MAPPASEEDLAHLLAKVPLFSSLDKRHLKTIARSGVERSFAAGQSIVKQGDEGVGFYLVLEGQVAVPRANQVLAPIGPGQFFGEMALFDKQPRTADVVAKVPSHCLVLSSWEFWGSVSSQPEVLRELMQVVVRRLRASAPQALTE